ncbi:MAG: prolyl oligopeptidase family serine peptidase [Rikenellaceae bacterium]|nr:prolyl oligopeptidase family serine peptidase [Rikenellaceae bacterium]
MKYPFTRKDNDCVDDYFGVKIADPYRWLENVTLEETSIWIETQRKVTEEYFSRIPYREEIRKRLSELYNYESYGQFQKSGDYIYFFKNNGCVKQDILYRQFGFDGQSEIFIDPNKLSEEGTVYISGIKFSSDGKYMAYLLADAGSDWNTVKIINTTDGRVLSDEIKWTKFCQPQWRGNGFYYSGFDKPKSHEFSGINSSQKIYYHKLGYPQENDKIIFEDTAHPLRYFHPHISEDGKYLVIIASEGTSGDGIIIINLTDGSTERLIEEFSSDYRYISCRNDILMLITNESASNGRIIGVNLLTKKITEIVPEKDIVLEDAVIFDKGFILKYVKDVNNCLIYQDIETGIEKEIFTPHNGSIFLHKGTDSSAVFFSVKNYLNPATVYLATDKNIAPYKFKTSELPFNPEDFITKQIFYDSPDGTKIPMFISHKKDIKTDGSNPLHLYGYGGFNISLTPEFSPANLFFMEQGGVYAVANIRGGGEYGEQWHRQGMLENKQNVFNDFIAAAEYLIDQGYTNSSKLAISGGSNGGLLVAACMIQRPELFAVVIPRVGVLDMLRYHKFTVGWGWIVEYGCSDNKNDFEYLYKYSPLHNIKNGTPYPPTLVMTADHDDRVVPAHSFKFTAALQNAQSGENPVIIRIDRDAGHGAGKSRDKIIVEMTDMYSFILYHLNK